MRTGGVDAIGRDPPADLEQDGRLRPRRHHAPDEDALGSHVREASRVLDVDRVSGDVEAGDLAERLPGDGYADLVAAAHVVLLRREHVAMDGLARRAAHRLLERKARQRRALVRVILERQIEQAKVFPPRGLLLAAMPLEELRHEPARLLLFVALRGVDRHAVEQLRHHALGFLRGLGDLLAGLARVELRARQLVAARALGFGAQLLEPVAQPRRGHAVVAVVALDDGDVLGEFARRRMLHRGRARAAAWRAAGFAVPRAPRPKSSRISIAHSSARRLAVATRRSCSRVRP